MTDQITHTRSQCVILLLGLAVCILSRNRCAFFIGLAIIIMILAAFAGGALKGMIDGSFIAHCISAGISCLVGRGVIDGDGGPPQIPHWSVLIAIVLYVFRETFDNFTSRNQYMAHMVNDAALICYALLAALNKVVSGSPVAERLLSVRLLTDPACVLAAGVSFVRHTHLDDPPIRSNFHNAYAWALIFTSASMLLMFALFLEGDSARGLGGTARRRGALELTQIVCGYAFTVTGVIYLMMALLVYQDWYARPTEPCCTIHKKLEAARFFRDANEAVTLYVSIALLIAGVIVTVHRLGMGLPGSGERLPGSGAQAVWIGTRTTVGPSKSGERDPIIGFAGEDSKNEWHSHLNIHAQSCNPGRT